jgi:hypothetical protein
MSFSQIIISVVVSVLCLVSVHVFVLHRLLLIDCSYDVFGDSIFRKCVYDMILFMHKWYLGWYDFFVGLVYGLLLKFLFEHLFLLSN